MSHIKLFQHLRLINKIKSHMKDGSSDTSLAQELMEAFPDFVVDTLAFRAIDREWCIDDHFLNLSWSKSIFGAKDAFRSVYGSGVPSFVYKAKVKGFHLSEFINQARIYFKENLGGGEFEEIKNMFEFQYVDEEEILAIVYDQPVMAEKDDY